MLSGHLTCESAALRPSLYHAWLGLSKTQFSFGPIRYWSWKIVLYFEGIVKGFKFV